MVAAGLTTTSYADTNAVNGSTNYYQVAAASACGTSANSAAIAVFLPKPALSVSAGPGSITIQWPAWASDWALWSATNLTAPVAWAPVTNATSLDGQFMVTLPVAAGDCFFRLASP